ARQRAIRQYQDEELRKMQNRNKAKANQKTNAQQVELSLF
ncbi:PcfK-like protein, partial [Akkermansia sp. BIOML-A63]